MAALDRVEDAGLEDVDDTTGIDDGGKSAGLEDDKDTAGLEEDGAMLEAQVPNNELHPIPQYAFDRPQ